jgi:hypothetical protein
MLAQGPVGSSYSQLDIEQPSFPKKQTDHWSSLAVAITVAQSSCRHLEPRLLVVYNEVDILVCHARSQKAISFSRPKTSLPVTGHLATEISDSGWTGIVGKPGMIRLTVYRPDPVACQPEAAKLFSVWPSPPFKDGLRPLRNSRSAFLDAA